MRAIDADGIAAMLGRSTVTNVALLGFTSALNVLPFSTDALKETITRMTPERLLELNLRAFDEGIKASILTSNVQRPTSISQ